MLEECEPSLYGSTWVELRMNFARKFTIPYIFSTRFGANFFDEVESFLLNDKYLTPPKGEQLSEYDKNFNNWLKVARTIK